MKLTKQALWLAALVGGLVAYAATEAKAKLHGDDAPAPKKKGGGASPSGAPTSWQPGSRMLVKAGTPLYADGLLKQKLAKTVLVDAIVTTDSGSFEYPHAVAFTSKGTQYWFDPANASVPADVSLSGRRAG